MHLLCQCADYCLGKNLMNHLISKFTHTFVSRLHGLLQAEDIKAVVGDSAYSVVIAIMSSDSTLSYYSLNLGLP